MKECAYLDECPIFARFKNGGAAGMWVAMYCRGEKQSECARLQRRLSGAPVPENMLPNGTLAPHLSPGRPR